MKNPMFTFVIPANDLDISGTAHLKHLKMSYDHWLETSFLYIVGKI